MLNEICADAGSAAISPGGTAADYIELYNTSTTPVDLSLWSLTDDDKAINKYQFPQGTTIPAKSFLTVWLHSSAYPGLVCTNFGLSASGEEVILYRSSILQDYVKFGPQAAGIPVCRIPDGSGTWAPGLLTPDKSNQGLAALGVPTALKLNEWLATNSAGADFDWLEIYNPRANGPVRLDGLVISDEVGTVTTPAIIPNSCIGSGEFLRFWCDNTSTKGNHLGFRLSSTSGETLSIYAANRVTVIDRVVFGPQSRDVSMGRLPDGGTNVLYFAGTNAMTPGDPNAYLSLNAPIINEVLAHTDPPLEDAIELFNPTAATIDISGWWISNDPDVPYKFRVPAGTSIPAGGYKVFYEQNQLNGFSSVPGFNRSGTGDSPDFTLNSAHGDSVVLFPAAANGALTGHRIAKSFGASDNGISFGRYVKSTGGTDFVPMAGLTFGTESPTTINRFRSGTGLPNSGPLVGPVVISEILYHPPPLVLAGVTNDNNLDEYIELANFSDNPVALYDPAFPTNCWRLRGGVEFDFPRSTVLAANSRLLVVNFDPAANLTQLAAFRATYNVPAAVPFFGPYGGKLNNTDDSVEVQKPDAVQMPPHPDAGFVPFVPVEKVRYQLVDGWPTNASGTGQSIQRMTLSAYSNDPTNWVAAPPTAGKSNTTSPPPVAVKILSPSMDASGFTFSFLSEAARRYAVEYKTETTQTGWQTLTNLTGTGGILSARDSTAAGSSTRFYRVSAQ